MGDSHLSSWMGKTQKEAAKIPASGYGIPEKYEDNKIILMIRDPWTLYSYWEIKKDVEDRVRREILSKNLTPSKSILRVYEIDEEPRDNYKVLYDFELRDWANSWYVHTSSPGKRWKVDIGIICVNGEFFALATSNVVRGPNYGMSDIVDDEWMCPEELYYKLFGKGVGVGTSSLEMKEVLEKHLKSWLSSGGITSGMFGSASFHLQEKK